MSKQQIGVVGMAVMGKNLALNIESRGYSVSVFNRSGSKTEQVIAENPDKETGSYLYDRRICRVFGKTKKNHDDGKSWGSNRQNDPIVAASFG